MNIAMNVRDQVAGSLLRADAAKTTEDASENAMLDDITNRVHIGIGRVARTAERLASLGDRVFGELPRGAAAIDPKAPITNGAADRVYSALNTLDEMLETLESEAGRLFRIA